MWGIRDKVGTKNRDKAGQDGTKRDTREGKLGTDRDIPLGMSRPVPFVPVPVGCHWVGCVGIIPPC